MCMYALSQRHVQHADYNPCNTESIMALYVLDIGTLFGLIRKAVRYFAAFYLAEFWFSQLGRPLQILPLFCPNFFDLNLLFPVSF